jgi:hypothetical protein
MSHHNEHEAATQSESGVSTSRARRRRTVVVGIATIGGLVLIAPQVLPASAEPHVVSASSSTLTALAPKPKPPPGGSWIQGVLTDQARHTLNNVNVEAWPVDPTATEPVASNLTYAGDPKDGRHQSGVFRLEVPAATPYRIKFSAVGGVEDGDRFRMQAYGGGRPIMTRETSPGQRTRASAVVAPSGRIVDLGTTQLVRQGTVSSKTKARLSSKKVKAGRHGKLSVQVTSHFVSNVTGKVQVRVSGKKATDRLAASDHGKTTIRLPKLKRGSHMVSVKFQGTHTVATSKAKKVRLIVMKKK